MFVCEGGLVIKLEIVLEGCIEFDVLGFDDVVVGVWVLVFLDLVVSKLFVLVDCWCDDSVFSCDLIDLVMM